MLKFSNISCQEKEDEQMDEEDKSADTSNEASPADSGESGNTITPANNPHKDADGDASMKQSNVQSDQPNTKGVNSKPHSTPRVQKGSAAKGIVSWQV